MSGIVVDAAAVVDLLCGLPAGAEVGRVLQRADAVAAPGHLDAEVLSALARLRRGGELPDAPERVAALARFGAVRWPIAPLVWPAWQLLDRVAARDALYVALARSLGAALLTTDARLRRASEGLVALAG